MNTVPTAPASGDCGLGRKSVVPSRVTRIGIRTRMVPGPVARAGATRLAAVCPDPMAPPARRYVVYGWALMLLLLPVAAAASDDYLWNEAGGCRDYDGTKLYVEAYPGSPRAKEGRECLRRWDVEADEWDGVKGCTDIEKVQAFERNHPEGRFVEQARACLNRLMAELAVERQLGECREHQRQHRLTTGSGGNALDCYRNVLDQDPGNRQALAGIESIETYYSARAYEAVEGERPDAARSSIERLESINPEHPEVANLRARLEELMHALKERDRLEREREALRAEVESLLDRNRYEEALSRLEEGRKGRLGDKRLDVLGQRADALAKAERLLERGEFAGARARLDEALRHGLDEADHGERLRRVERREEEARAEALQALLRRCAEREGEERLPAALECYRQVMAMEPGHAQAAARVRDLQMPVAWAEATQSRSVEGYYGFERAYRGTSLARLARKRLGDLEAGYWTGVVEAAGTRDAYERYLEIYSNGRFAPLAKRRVLAED